MPRTRAYPEIAEYETESLPDGRELRLDGPQSKVTLISPYGDISSTGIRLLAACLKMAGINTRMLFLPISTLESRGDIPFDVFRYPEDVLCQVADHCVGSLFVGISFMSNYYDRVVQLSDYLRDTLGIPVVLGGVHPTLIPEECARFADYLCIGEGEDAVIELAEDLANGGDGCSVRNIWPIKNGAPIRGGLRPLIQNLDALPFPDYDLEDDFVLCEGELIKMTPELLGFFFQEGPIKSVTDSSYYVMLSSRGCKFSCSYCSNTALKALYPQQHWVRYRSPQSIVAEIAEIKERIPSIASIFFCDDSFIERSAEELAEFCMLYKRQTDLPFFCLGTPRSITAEKLAMLTDAGLRYVQVGIETGSPRTSKLYRRDFGRETLLQMSDLLHQFSDRTLPPRYDVIVDNPFETRDDVAQTVELLSRMKRPYFIQYFCLTLLPGTELAAKAQEEGILTDKLEQVYRKQLFYKKKTYLNFLLYLLNTPVPAPLIRFCATKPVRFFFDRRYFEGALVLLVKLKKRLFGAPSEGIKGLLRRG